MPNKKKTSQKKDQNDSQLISKADKLKVFYIFTTLRNKETNVLKIKIMKKQSIIILKPLN